MVFWKKNSVISFLLFSAAFAFFCVNLQEPTTANFDEFHYIPAMKSFAYLGKTVNAEHPPLGKELMALGILAGGDGPIGWRIMSVIFGALSLVGIFWIGVDFWGSRRTGFLCYLLSICNGLIYVQSRIGMLDIFLFCFLTYALLYFFRIFLDSQNAQRNLNFTGLFLGLASAVKWYSLVPWGLMGIFLFAIKLPFWKELSLPISKRSRNRLISFSHNVSMSKILLGMLLIPFGVYFVTYLPYLWMEGGADNLGSIFFDLQYRIWDGQRRVVGQHVYQSQFWQWPLILRPIWYHYVEGPPTFMRGIMLLGNPWQLWTGLLALLYSYKRAFWNRDGLAWAVCFLWTIFYGSWLIIPRKVAFYYYYIPAGTFLTFSIVYFLENFFAGQRKKWAIWIYLGIAVACFLFFLPIFGDFLVPTKWMRYWMWSIDWI